jgi:methanogenic corrinoid protein MtbC1
MSQELIQALSEFRKDDALKTVSELIEKGMDPSGILDICRVALAQIGHRFEIGEAFIPELIMAGEIMEQIASFLQPEVMKTPRDGNKGKIIIGTVAGDIHNIGKDIVCLMLDVHGFEVHDLGVDVKPQVFLEKIAEIKPKVLGLSGLLTSAFTSMKDTIEAIEKAGLRDTVKIAIGGASVDEHVKFFTGADGWGNDAMKAVNLAKQWIGGR